MFETEYKEMRKELRDLKLCQRQYFFVAVGGTGALLGLSRFATSESIGFILLAPLVLLLPCWVMFFDKATSITRLTGYLRYVEEALAGRHGTEPKFFGFETAVAKFREIEHGSSKSLSFDALIPWYTRHRYWKSNWYTYFCLSGFSVVASIYWVSSTSSFAFGWLLVWVASLLAWGYMTYLTIVILTQLTRGKYGYDEVAKFWHKEVFPALA